MFFQGYRTEEELLPVADKLILFAFSLEHSFRGESDVAEQMSRDIVTSSSEGFWPAEAELVFARGGEW